MRFKNFGLNAVSKQTMQWDVNVIEMNLIIRQFMSFSFVGAIGTCAHFLVLAGMVQLLHFHPVTGSVAGFVTGAIINYLLNYYFTFKSSTKHLATSLKFFLIALSGLALNTLLMYWMTPTIHYLLSQAIATSIVLIWNFICNRFWTFREVNFVNQ
jgi:putative flippase GtrA